MNVIQTNNLGFGYQTNHWFSSKKDHDILKGISLEIKEGEVFVLLGHNGAGKTTLFRVLLNFLPITSGEAFVLGIPVFKPEARANVGYLSEHPIFYPHLDGPSFLELFADLGGITGDVKKGRIATLLEKTGLISHGNKPLTSYSKGMLQRLNLCRCLLANPKVVFLDEPILGLDPLGQQLVREIITEMRSEGKTIFINTHATAFAREIADRIAFIMAGALSGIINRSEVVAVEPPFIALVQGHPQSFSERFSSLIQNMVDENTFSILLPDEKTRNELLVQSVHAEFQVISLTGASDPIERRFNLLAAELDAKEKAQ